VLVETGRSALGRGDWASALAALDKHAREFPHGRLAEERDVLRVQALALGGRTDEARTRAEAFRARYPKSVFLPLLDDALR
jgi:outer membrane protein assembly factor BamD (BamD/ComL family)